MRIKRVFPNILLILGVVSIFFVWTPGVEASNCPEYGQYSEQSGWSRTSSFDIPSGKCTFEATHTNQKTGDKETVVIQETPSKGSSDLTKSITSVDSNNAGDTRVYNKQGRLIDETRQDGKGGIQEYTYDGKGNKTSFLGKDSQGNSQTIKFGPDGSVTSKVVVDAKLGTATKSTFDPTWGEQQMQFDNKSGQLIGTTNIRPDGSKETVDYSPGCPGKSGGAGCNVSAVKKENPNTGTSSITINDPGTGKRTEKQEFDPKTGLVTTTKYDQTGANVISTQTGKSGAALAPQNSKALQSGTNKIQATDDKSKTKSAEHSPLRQQIQGLKEGKQNIKADILNQIGDKSSGQPTDAKDKVKEGFAKGEFQPGRAIPKSQSPSQVLQGNKPLPQVEKPKAISKPHNLGSSAGSHGSVKRHPVEKLQ